MLHAQCTYHSGIFQKLWNGPVIEGKIPSFCHGAEISGRQDNFLKEVPPDDRWDPKAPREKGIFSSKTGQFHNFFTSATLDKPGEPMKSTLTL